MKKMVCECCGGYSIIKISSEFYQCEDCGVKYKNDDISSLLIEVAEEVLQKNSPKLTEILSNAKRSLDNGNWNSAYRLAEDALNIDSQSPEALLYAGTAIGMSNATHVVQAISYTRDALLSKVECCSEEEALYRFESEALMWINRVVQTGLQSVVQVTYGSKFSKYQQESENRRIQENQEAFRQAVTRGEKYYARSESPGIVDTAFDAIMARNDANSVKKGYLEKIVPEVKKLTDFLLDQNYQKLDASGCAALAQLLTFSYGQRISVSYNHRKEIEKECMKVQEVLQYVSNHNTDVSQRKEIEKVLSNINKAIKETEQLEQKGPRSIRAMVGADIVGDIFIGLCAPVLSVILLLCIALPRYTKMRRTGLVKDPDSNNGEFARIPQEMIDQYRKKFFIMLCWYLPLSLGFIVLFCEEMG